MKRTQHPENDFSTAMKIARKSKGLSQEAFGLVSSRTYVSALERGQYSPTLSKVDQLADVLNLHPLTLIALAYLSKQTAVSVESLLARVQTELTDLVSSDS